MIKFLNKLLLSMIIIISPSMVFAFEMNPIAVDCWGKSYLCDITRYSSRLKFPVHETMTLLAWDCCEKPDTCKGGDRDTSAESPHKSGRLRDLVLGSEWNDDPDSLLRQKITKDYQWYALFKDAKLEAKCKIHPEPKCKSVKITQNPMMLYRSHFGDLQFIHSMASADDEIAQATKEKMMAWAKFTYSIFTAKDNLENRDISWSEEISKLINKPGWTGCALFDPVAGGEWKKSFNPFKFGHYEPNGKPRTYNRGDGISVKLIALGSLLHMIQDSYSASHVYREFNCNSIARDQGKIKAFRNYASQNGDDHSIADAYPEWLKHGGLPTDNPVWASAQVIKFAFHYTPWKEVEEFLDTKVFPLTDPHAKPEPGDKDCFEGKGGN
jgi:hypothetical protein